MPSARTFSPEARMDPTTREGDDDESTWQTVGRRRGGRSGDGTITDLGTLVVDNGGTGFDELNLSETGHDLTIVWDTNTHATHSVSHGWGAGYSQCVEGTATPCDPAKVAIDFAGRSVVFTNLALTDDPFATGSTCTLNGTAIW
jgi:hypothetical protein